MELLFIKGTEHVLIKVKGGRVTFSTQTFGAFEATIDGLKLDYAGCCREWPDLETKQNWKEIAIQRFKEKILSIKNDEERTEFIIEDLKKHGYIPLYKQREGFRRVRLNG